jgi:hypothetical protein
MLAADVTIFTRVAADMARIPAARRGWVRRADPDALRGPTVAGRLNRRSVAHDKQAHP